MVPDLCCLEASAMAALLLYHPVWKAVHILVREIHAPNRVTLNNRRYFHADVIATHG